MGFKLELGDLVEDFGVPGLAIGIGAVVLAPLFGTGLAKVGKPVAKAVIKTGMVVLEKSKNVWAEAVETFEDIVAESKSELAEANTEEVLTLEAQNEAI